MGTRVGLGPVKGKICETPSWGWGCNVRAAIPNPYRARVTNVIMVKMPCRRKRRDPLLRSGVCFILSNCF